MIPARRYAREIESRWSALLERPVVFGERDWALICDWHAREIPLQLIDEAIDQFGEKLRRRRTPPRNLGVVAPLVEDAWRTVCGGRAEPTRPASSNPEQDPLRTWRRSVEALEQDDPLRGWLQGLLERLAAGGSAERCEEMLQAGLPDRLSARIRAQLEAEVDAALAAFRGRMTRETWETTRHRALVATARRRLGLPVLNDPAPSPQSDETF